MTQGSRLMIQKELVQRQLREENVLTVERAGIKILKVLYTVNTKMEFRHPKYYKELRKRNKLDQAISNSSATAPAQRAPGPGHKQQASSCKHQAPSSDKNS